MNTLRCIREFCELLLECYQPVSDVRIHRNFIRNCQANPSSYGKWNKSLWDSNMLKIFQIWQSFQNKNLQTSIRIVLNTYRMIEEFRKRLLFLGEGRYPVGHQLKPNTNKHPGAVWGRINEQILPKHQWTLSESQVLQWESNVAPKNVTENINFKTLQILTRECQSYKCIDTVVEWIISMLFHQ